MSCDIIKNKDGLPSILKKDEQVTLRLRQVYENYGYKKFKMSKFEDYDLYQANKSFLKSESIITFNDLDGKLLALKPDVTLSIIKNTNGSGRGREKLYYTENVYRLVNELHAYKEINQLGLECMGDIDIFATAEIVELARRSLETVSSGYILEISHVGFIVSLFESLGIDAETRDMLIGFIKGKNRHELAGYAAKKGLDAGTVTLLETLTELDGEFEQSIAKARGIAVSREMTEALDELEQIYALLSATGSTDNIRIDFSDIGDIDYYSGIMIRGFVQGIPRAVLAGGRYDNLMKRFGKEAGGIGFAMYLDELEYFARTKTQYDIDVLIIYDDTADMAKLAAKVKELAQAGSRVRAERNMPDGIRCKQICKFTADGPEEVKND